MSHAGFVNVKTRIFRCPTNDWPTESEEKQIGRLVCDNYSNYQSVLDGISRAFLRLKGGFMKEEVDVLLANVRNDFRDPKICAYIPMYVLVGQKPDLEP